MTTKMTIRDYFWKLIFKPPKNINYIIDLIIIVLSIILSIILGIYLAYYMSVSSPGTDIKVIIIFSLLVSLICFSIILCSIRYLSLGLYLLIKLIIQKPDKINKGFDRIFIIISILLSSMLFIYIITEVARSSTGVGKIRILIYLLLFAFLLYLFSLWVFRCLNFLIIWIKQGFEDRS